MVVDKSSRIPVYVQLIDYIVDLIKTETLHEHEKIPSEREMCERFDVSRATVRQAMQSLESDGYIYTKKGIGSFVAEQQMYQEMSGFYSYTESMKELGKTISTDLVQFEKTSCDSRLALKMKCSVGTEIYRFTRLRYADNEPLFLATTHMPVSRFPDLSANLLVKHSLYELMKDKYHVLFDSVHETLQSVVIKPQEADLLKVEYDSPCMKINRYSYEGDSIIEYAVGIAGGDKFKYRIKLK